MHSRGFLAPQVVPLSHSWLEFSRGLQSRGPRSAPPHAHGLGSAILPTRRTEDSIFLRAAPGLEPLRRHFHRFLKVRDEQGRSLVFRYYDPRVLRAYAPTCNAGELEYLFGDVHQLYAESEGADALLALSREGGQLTRRTLALADAGRSSPA